MDTEYARLPLFSGIRETDLPVMLDCLGYFQKQYEKGEIILLESDAVGNIGIVLAGAVHMVKENEAGGHALLVSLGPGELLGESFSCGRHLTARVSFFAGDRCTVLFLPFQRILHTCQNNCPFHQRLIENMVGLLADKNVQLMEKIDIISRKSLREKILAYLHSLSVQQGSRTVTVPLGRTELAAYLCADRTALARELSRMASEGLIVFDKNQFEILKRS